MSTEKKELKRRLKESNYKDTEAVRQAIRLYEKETGHKLKPSCRSCINKLKKWFR